jgi:hypothetical protein
VQFKEKKEEIVELMKIFNIKLANKYTDMSYKYMKFFKSLYSQVNYYFIDHILEY